MFKLRNIIITFFITTAIAGKHKPTCNDCKTNVAPCYEKSRARLP